MSQSDFEILELKALKNEVESYSYELRNGLDSYGSLEKYEVPEKRQEIVQVAN